MQASRPAIASAGRHPYAVNASAPATAADGPTAKQSVTWLWASEFELDWLLALQHNLRHQPPAVLRPTRSAPHRSPTRLPDDRPGTALTGLLNWHIGRRTQPP